jgi:hypothetical protein
MTKEQFILTHTPTYLLQGKIGLSTIPEIIRHLSSMYDEILAFILIPEPAPTPIKKPTKKKTSKKKK